MDAWWCVGVAWCCLLLLVVAWCCLVLLVVAWCCLVLLVVACCCLLLLVVGTWCVYNCQQCPNDFVKHIITLVQYLSKTYIVLLRIFADAFPPLIALVLFSCCSLVQVLTLVVDNLVKGALGAALQLLEYTLMVTKARE